MTNPEQLRVPTMIVEQTLAELKAAGRRDAEGVVLWLGRRAGDGVDVVEAHVPRYESRRDNFIIPRESMAALLRHLGESKTFIAAQVHSHPQLAFHSEADDEWAIVRHLHALSLVVPHFAFRTSAASFMADIAAFSLSELNVWTELSPAGAARRIEVI